jgi:hypothetical protein
MLATRAAAATSGAATAPTPTTNPAARNDEGLGLSMGYPFDEPRC